MFGLKVIAALLLVTSTAAMAVGLGPLEKSGVTATEAKGFYLTLTNPYKQPFRFRTLVDEETPALEGRVRIFPEVALMAPESNRKVLVVVRDLVPGEQVDVRVCAERIENKEVVVHARVCSKLSARRVGTVR